MIYFVYILSIHIFVFAIGVRCMCVTVIVCYDDVVCLYVVLHRVGSCWVVWGRVESCRVVLFWCCGVVCDRVAQRLGVSRRAVACPVVSSSVHHVCSRTCFTSVKLVIAKRACDRNPRREGFDHKPFLQRPIFKPIKN